MQSTARDGVMRRPDRLDAAQELGILSFAIRLLLAQSDRQLLIASGVEALADFSQSERVALFLLSPCGENLSAAGSIGSNMPVGTVPFAVAGTPFEEVITSKQPRRFALTDVHGLPCPIADTGVVGRQCLCVPLVEAHNRVIGVATLDQPAATVLDATTMQCLLILQSVFAVSLENTRMWDELQQAHDEMQALYHAKSKMIDHLSHELKTPLAILSASAKLLQKPSVVQNDTRRPAILERMHRHIARLLELEAEAQDIAERRLYSEKFVLDTMLRQCRDLLNTLLDDHAAAADLHTALARRIDDLYLPVVDDEERHLFLHRWVPEVLARLAPLHRHRHIRLELELEEAPAVRMPESPLYKAFSGLVRNAIEYTPDGGTIRIELHWRDGGLYLRVRDFGIGIDEAFQRLLFHGFMHAGETQDYTSGRPYDFQAGGKGLDLLRTVFFPSAMAFACWLRASTVEAAYFPWRFQLLCLSWSQKRVKGGTWTQIDIPQMLTPGKRPFRSTSFKNCTSSS
jgi:signal transduction histidine kinase